MKRPSTGWKKRFRRRMAGCAIGGSVALSSAACYAANAFDNASDPVYADGWQAGDNGGFGFTPWNFDDDGTGATEGQAGFKMIDNGLKAGTQFSNPFNDIGRAWTIGSPDGAAAPHVGRGFAPLQVNQTLKVVFDNPTKRRFFKGYIFRLNGGSGGTSGNICYAGNPCSAGASPTEKMSWYRFEYFNYGAWRLSDSAGNTTTNVFDTDTAAAGALLQVTRTGDETYDVVVDSFGLGAADLSTSGTFKTGAPVDWIEFVFFNPASDTDTPPTTATPAWYESFIA
jgi:hypothetical protein